MNDSRNTAARSLCTVSLATLVLSALFVTFVPNQASGAYRLPSNLTLVPVAPLSPGHVVSQTVIANDTQWAYFVSVPPTYDTTASKRWPCILFMPTLECDYNSCCATDEGIIMTTHCWNGGLAEIMQTPAICSSFYDRFVVLTPFVDQPMIGANQGGTPGRLAGFINYMKTHLKIDSTQISFMGHCWGSGVLYNLAVAFPKLPSCMVLINGNDNWASTYNAANACKLVNIPIKMLAADNSNDSLDMTAAHNAIQACGTNKETITYFHNNMHEMWSGPLICGGVGVDTMKSIYDWMLTNQNATAVAPRLSSNRNAGISINSISVNDRLEVIGLNGRIIAQNVAGVSKIGRLLFSTNNGVRLIRITRADGSVQQMMLSRP